MFKKTEMERKKKSEKSKMTKDIKIINYDDSYISIPKLLHKKKSIRKVIVPACAVEFLVSLNH